MIGNSAKLKWEVHGGNPTGIVVERKIDNGDSTKETWTRIAKLSNSATEYSDSALNKGDRVAYRVRAINSDGESAYSNIARGAVAARQ